jgi:hypothetical protein
MEPVQGVNLNCRYISGLESEMTVTTSSHGYDFAKAFSVERIERYSVFRLAWLFEICFFLILLIVQKNLFQLHNLLLVMICECLGFLSNLGKPSITFLSLINCKNYTALIWPLEGPHATVGPRSLSFIRFTVNSPLAAGRQRRNWSFKLMMLQ